MLVSASGGLPTIAWLLMAVHVCSLNEHNHEDDIHFFIAFPCFSHALQLFGARILMCLLVFG